MRPCALRPRAGALLAGNLARLLKAGPGSLAGSGRLGLLFGLQAQQCPFDAVGLSLEP